MALKRAERSFSPSTTSGTGITEPFIIGGGGGGAAGAGGGGEGTFDPEINFATFRG